MDLVVKRVSLVALKCAFATLARNSGSVIHRNNDLREKVMGTDAVTHIVHGCAHSPEARQHREKQEAFIYLPLSLEIANLVRQVFLPRLHIPTTYQ